MPPTKRVYEASSGVHEPKRVDEASSDVQRKDEASSEVQEPKRAKQTHTKVARGSAPGKLILFGEHAVVYPSMRALACALGLATTATVSLNERSPTTFVSLPDVGVESFDFKWDQLEMIGIQLAPGDLSVDDALAQRLDRMLGSDVAGTARRAIVALLVLCIGICRGIPPPLSIKVESQIPTGSGLGSSASFCASVAAALLLYTDAISPISNDDSTGDSDGKERDKELAADRRKADLEKINEWALCGEKVLHGLVSGVDNTVVCYGGANIYIKGEPLRPLKGFPPLRMLLTNTRVEKDTKKQVAIVSQRMRDLPHSTGNIVKAIDGVVDDCCGRLTSHTLGKVGLNSVQYTLATLIQMNHGLLTSLGVSHPSLEAVVRVTRAHGLHGTKLTGAGGGGCALTLIPDDFDAQVLERVKEELEQVEGFECFESRVGCGGVHCSFVKE